MTDVDREDRDSVGIVVIGRNESARLATCLASVKMQSRDVIYVDSGSTDGSVGLARSSGVEVIELDEGPGYSAARARNAGLATVAQRKLSLVQFVDGDCELESHWARHASSFLTSHNNVAVVVGHLVEKEPNASLWNRLCNLEWFGPVGDLPTCGGIFMGRTDVLSQMGGFREDLIAGEEPELCVRLRLNQWRVYRIDVQMATHDAAMTRFGQWWKRATRAGHAYAEGAAMHGRGPLKHNVSQVRSTLLWGAAIPLALLACLIASIWFPLVILGAAAIVLLLAVQWVRIAQGCRTRDIAVSDAHLYATFVLIAKPAGAMGIAKYWLNRLRGKRSGLIEYKNAKHADPAASTT